MDTSEEYIKMCEKAEEIQEESNHNWGSWYSVDGKIIICEYIEIRTWKEGAIWLPRQDQLQDLIDIQDSERNNKLHRIFFAFRCFVQNEDADSWWDFLDQFTSFEQLWLAFVMSERYSKVWDGNNWVKK